MTSGVGDGVNVAVGVGLGEAKGTTNGANTSFGDGETDNRMELALFAERWARMVRVISVPVTISSNQGKGKASPPLALLRPSLCINGSVVIACQEIQHKCRYPEFLQIIC